MDRDEPTLLQALLRTGLLPLEIFLDHLADCRPLGEDLPDGRAVSQHDGQLSGCQTLHS